jgi:hypothetical protein
MRLTRIVRVLTWYRQTLQETLNMDATRISLDAGEALELYMAADQFVFAN